MGTLEPTFKMNSLLQNNTKFVLGGSEFISFFVIKQPFYSLSLTQSPLLD